MSHLFFAAQVLFAVCVDVSYVSPFVGKIDDVNTDGISLIEDIASIHTR